MKNFTLVLLIFLPFLVFAQEPLPQIREKTMTKTTFGKSQIIQPLQKMEEQQKEFSLNSISEKIKQLQTEEELFNNSFQEIFPGREIIEKLREYRLKSAQADTLLIDSLYMFTFSSPTDSVLTGKIFATYNAKGNFGHVWRLELDTLTLQWHNTSKDDYFYDENDRNTSYINYEWDVVKSDWLPVSKHEMEYDSNDRRTISANYDWNNHLKKWIGRYKVENAWDVLGNQIMEAWYFGDEITGAWIGNYKYETSYDETGKQILYVNYQWNSSTNNWQGSVKQDIAYDEMGNITLSIHSAWIEVYGGWISLSKHESVFGQDGSVQTADYIWDQNNIKWIGQNKTETYILNQTEHCYISYSWNIMEDSWEESAKSLSKWFNDGLSHQLTSYSKQDSIIPGLIINGFNTEEDINTIWTDLSCPEQTCSVLDSDFVEGTASIRWDYQATGKINYGGGTCQFEMLNRIDLSDFDGISMNYKVLEPSFARFVFVLIESDGEVWEYNNFELTRDTSDYWKVVTVPFNNMQARNYVDGLNLKNIKKILIQAFSEPGTENSGTILLDNLSACNITKSKLWIPESFTEEIRDEHDNLISSTQSRWDPYLQEFIALSKNKYEVVYDENGNIISKNFYEWNDFMESEEWRNRIKEEFEYDEYGNQTRSEVYGWSEYDNEWIGGNRFEKSYDENGNILTSVEYQWHYAKKDWIPRYREENTIIADSIQTSHAFYSYDLNLNKWIGNNKHETYFNDALEAIKEIDYEWDFNTDTWKILNINIIEHDEYQYDAEGRLQAYVLEIWNETLNQWSAAEKYYYFWSLHGIATEMPEVLIQKGLVEVYPNPATVYICVKTAPGFKNGTINIYNNSGQIVKTLKTVGDVTNINANDLSTGNYILQYATDKDVCVKKIIIR